MAVLQRWHTLSFLHCVEHAPWPLRHATVHRVAETLTRAAGLGALCGEPVAHFGGDVDARLSRPHLVRNWTLERANR